MRCRVPRFSSDCGQLANAQSLRETLSLRPAVGLNSSAPIATDFAPRSDGVHCLKLLGISQGHQQFAPRLAYFSSNQTNLDQLSFTLRYTRLFKCLPTGVAGPTNVDGGRIKSALDVCGIEFLDHIDAGSAVLGNLVTVPRLRQNSFLTRECQRETFTLDGGAPTETEHCQMRLSPRRYRCTINGEETRQKIRAAASNIRMTYTAILSGLICGRQEKSEFRLNQSRNESCN